jgi:hypothetical protein
VEYQTNPSLKKSIAKKILFLLLSFPFGLCYFILTVVGIVLGMGTIVLWVGIPILFGTLIMVGGVATIERYIIKSLLGLPVQDYQTQDSEQRHFLTRFRDIFCDPFTWTRLVYVLFLKLPLGILSFVLVVTLLSVTLVLTFLPLGYLIQLLVNTILLANGIEASSYVIPHFLEVTSKFDLVMFARSFIGIPVGVVFWLVTRFILSGLASLSGELAIVMLGLNVERQSHRSEPAYVPVQNQNYQAR